MAVAAVMVGPTTELPGSPCVDATLSLMVNMLARITIGAHLLGIFNVTRANVSDTPRLRVICLPRLCSSQNT